MRSSTASVALSGRARVLPSRASHTFAVLSELRCDDARAVRAERHAPHPARVAFQFEQECPRPRVPDLRRPASHLPAADDPRAVRAERRATSPGSVWPLSSSKARPRPRVPHLRRPVRTACDDSRVPSGLNDTLTHRPCALSVRGVASRPRVPHLRCAVRTACDDPRPVRAERRAHTAARVAIKGEQAAAREPLQVTPFPAALVQRDVVQPFGSQDSRRDCRRRHWPEGSR